MIQTNEMIGPTAHGDGPADFLINIHLNIIAIAFQYAAEKIKPSEFFLRNVGLLLILRKGLAIGKNENQSH